MANRSMQSKALKHTRQRRAWAKSLSRKGAMQPNREVIQGYKLHARGLEDKEFIDRIADEILPNLEQNKRQALRKQGTLEAWLPEGCILKSQGPGFDGRDDKWLTYSNSRKDCLVVIHMDIKDGIERRSTTFSSRELLMMSWELGAIRWVYKARME